MKIEPGICNPLQRPFVHVSSGPDGMIVRGDAEFGTYHDLAQPGSDQGIFSEWAWDGSTLRLRNCLSGLCPLYYHATSQEIWVSTSLIRLLAEGVPDNLDDAAMAFFLRRGFYAGEDTPFQHIRILPPNARGEWNNGSGLRISGGPPLVKPQPMTRDQAMDAFIEVFRAAIRRRAPRGDFAVPLSGGRDSRHVLLELCAAGYRPKECITMRHFPPRVDEDARVAGLLTQALGLEHVVLDHAPSLVALERRKNAIMDFSTDWGAWFLTVIDHINGGVAHLYGGFGGDTLARGVQPDERRMELWKSGNLEELATYMMCRRPANELALQLLLEPWAYERFNQELARQCLLAELQRHVDQPNPDLSFTLQNALRRRTGPQWFPLSSDVAHIQMPYLDREVHDLLASLPADMALDKRFHTDAIQRAFPRYQDIPFEDPKFVKRTDAPYFRRVAGELTEYATSRGGSSVFNRRRLAERLSGCRISGDGRLLKWMDPPRILCMLQMEDAVAKAKARIAPNP